jgi:hydroxymethylbilane synthase
MPIFPKREDPRDALLSLKYNSIDDLPEKGNVGTGSLRRTAMLLRQRPDLNIVSLRGNVDTRIKKLETDDLHGIILAAAGLKRLGLSSRIKQILEPKDFLPAVGQGAIGIELRIGDDKTIDLLSFLNDKSTESVVRAERGFLKELGGGCQVPIAGYCLPRGDKELLLEGMVAGLDGKKIIRGMETGTRDNPDEIGVALAQRLLDSGAEQILSGIYGEEKK